MAVVLFGMPVGQALLAGTEGAAFGFFPILWIVINAIWVYNLTVASGHFDVLRRSFEKVSADQRIQAIIIAFCFGALLEALAGFGTPVAITVVMLMALGFQPRQGRRGRADRQHRAGRVRCAGHPDRHAGTDRLGRERRPSALRRTLNTLGSMVGRQTPILAVVVPLILVFVVDGRRGVRQTWLPALRLRRRSSAVAQFVDLQLHLRAARPTSSPRCWPPAPLVLLVRVWQPSEVLTAEGAVGRVRGRCTRRLAGWRDDVDRRRRDGDRDRRAGRRRRRPSIDSRGDVLRAYAPYLVIIAIFSIANITAVKDFLAKEPLTYIFDWPGLDVTQQRG